MKLLVDMNLSPRWVNFLEGGGFEAQPTRRTRKSCPLLVSTNGDRPSVAQIRSDEVSPDVIGELVVDALRQVSAEFDEGALLTIDPKRTRIRVLPLPGNRP